MRLVTALPRILPAAGKFKNFLKDPRPVVKNLTAQSTKAPQGLFPQRLRAQSFPDTPIESTHPMQEILEDIFDSLVDGDAVGVQRGVQAALAAGIPPFDILNRGMIDAMGEVGALFEAQEFFVPEMLVAARAMKQGIEILRPHLTAADVQPIATVVLGTVRGDLHDIGKNLVSMMLQGAGFAVVDLGVDISPERFVEAVRTHQPQLLGMSALLTTTMPQMRNTIAALEEAGLRSNLAVMVGGAPVTDAFAGEIGADIYAADASTAARRAKAWLGISGEQA